MKLKYIFLIPRADRRFLLKMLGLTAVIIAFFVFSENNPPSPDSLASSSSDSISTLAGRDAAGSMSSGRHRPRQYQQPQRKTELFAFDPNTADSTALLRLGLQEWQVEYIYRYRARGGAYRSKEDFAYLPGLTVKAYRSLEPYIRISPDFLPASTLVAGRKGGKDSVASVSKDTALYVSHKLKPGETIELNSADTATLKLIPGIGSFYARRITEYRKRLGGFVDARQLLEIDNVPETAIGYVRVDKSLVKKINVNRSTLKQLRQHPYMGYYRAECINSYVKTNREISDLSELSFSRDFSPEAIERLRPYVEY